MRSELEVVVGLNILKISRIEVEMKKFELYSAEFLNKCGKPKVVMNIVEANNYAEVIQELESNAGWYTGINGAFKVAYIEEVVE